MSNQKRSCSSGFSLLEISISITIIALAVVAVMAGASLIKQAGLRSVMSDISAIRSNIASFELSFRALPGDMDDADRKLSNAAITTVGGNSDGRITYNLTDGANNEALRAWQHLFLADTIAVEYSGSNPSQNAILNDNVPASQIEEGTAGYYLDHDSWLGSEAANMIVIGREDGDRMNDSAVLSPNNARSIDAKMDDGNPGKGLVLAREGEGLTGVCITTTGTLNEYASDDTDMLECIQAYIIEASD
ncbi:MAG: prepilin-type N-terminal cleavage/methylation domain-containing protein [Rickettsiales bacterium]|nr:prepilin-type N-terminal cleavage/methylation domain-containing protein [Rickettsiales bacterium]